MDLSEFLGDRGCLYKQGEVAIARSPRAGEYEVFVGGDHLNQVRSFYLAREMLDNSTRPELSTEDLIRYLNNFTNGRAGRMLSMTNVSPEKLRVALLHAKIAELEDELGNSLEIQNL